MNKADEIPTREDGLSVERCSMSRECDLADAARRVAQDKLRPDLFMNLNWPVLFKLALCSLKVFFFKLL